MCLAGHYAHRMFGARTMSLDLTSPEVPWSDYVAPGCTQFRMRNKDCMPQNSHSVSGAEGCFKHASSHSGHVFPSEVFMPNRPGYKRLSTVIEDCTAVDLPCRLRRSSKDAHVKSWKMVCPFSLSRCDCLSTGMTRWKAVLVPRVV